MKGNGRFTRRAAAISYIYDSWKEMSLLAEVEAEHQLEKIYIEKNQDSQYQYAWEAVGSMPKDTFLTYTISAHSGKSQVSHKLETLPGCM